MAMITVTCPACGSPTEFNPQNEFGFCTECGKKFEAAAVCPAADAVPDVPPAPAPEPAPEPYTEGGAGTNADALNLAMMSRLTKAADCVFHSEEECSAYADNLHRIVMDLDRRYGTMDYRDERSCTEFLNTVISYCDYFGGKSLKYLAGTVEKDGKTEAKYESWTVPRKIRADIADVKKKLITAFNGFYTPKIQDTKLLVNEVKDQIRSQPFLMRFSHVFTNIGFLCVFGAVFAVGLIVLLMDRYSIGFNWYTLMVFLGGALVLCWLVFFILYLVRGKDSKALYEKKRTLTEDLNTLKGMLK